MNRIFIVLLLILSILNLSGQTKQNDIPWPTLADSPWPMIKHDPQFTGRSKYKGPQNGTVIWKKDLSYGIFSGPVLDKNDNLFFGSYYYHSDAFYSYTKDGSPRWIFELGQKRPPSSGILIDSSNTIYFGARDSNFYAMNPNGTLKWKINVSAQIPELAIINIDLNGNLYVTNLNGDLCSISPMGKINWKVKYESGFASRSPVFAPDGQTIYIAGKDSNLFALDLGGNIKWKFKCGKIFKSASVDNSGNLYFFPLDTNEVTFYSIFPNGTLRWKYTIDQNYGNFEAFSLPTIDYDGNIYFVGVENVTYHRALFSLTNEGIFRWSHIFQEYFEDIYQPLICDSEGTIYVGSTYGLLYYAISNNGEVKWTLRLNKYQVDNTGAIGEDGTLYLGLHVTSTWDQNEQNLIAIKDTNTVSVENNISNIEEYSLFQNYPNPFNPSTTLRFVIPNEVRNLKDTRSTEYYSVLQNVTLKVYDVLGREVATLVNEQKPAGNYEVKFDASGLSSGIYFYSLRAGSFVETRKMILLR